MKRLAFAANLRHNRFGYLLATIVEGSETFSDPTPIRS